MNTMPDFVTDILKPIQARQSYVGGMAEKLARIVTDLLNEHEPLLKAECDGVEVHVTEKGGTLAFSFAIASGTVATRASPEPQEGLGHSASVELSQGEEA